MLGSLYCAYSTLESALWDSVHRLTAARAGESGHTERFRAKNSGQKRGGSKKHKICVEFRINILLEDTKPFVAHVFCLQSWSRAKWEQDGNVGSRVGGRPRSHTEREGHGWHSPPPSPSTLPGHSQACKSGLSQQRLWARSLGHLSLPSSCLLKTPGLLLTPARPPENPRSQLSFPQEGWDELHSPCLMRLLLSDHWVYEPELSSKRPLEFAVSPFH